jgi:hypothetical protein
VEHGLSLSVEFGEEVSQRVIVVGGVEWSNSIEGCVAYVGFRSAKA